MAVFSYVQSANTDNATSLAFGSNNTAGNLIVAFYDNFANALPGSVTDSQGNTYTKLTSSASTTQRFSIWVAQNIAAGANTVTFNGASATLSDIIIAEYAVPTDYHLVAQPIIQTDTTNTLPVSFPAIPVGSPAFPLEVMLITALYDSNSFHGWTISNGSIRETAHNPASATAVLGDWDVMTPTGAVSTTIAGTGSAGAWSGCSVVLMVPSGGGGGGGGGGAYTFVG